MQGMAELFVVEESEGGASWRTVFGVGLRGQQADGTFTDRSAAEKFAGGRQGYRVRQVSEPCLYFTGSDRGDVLRALDSIRSLASLGLGPSGNAYEARRALPVHLKLLARTIDRAYPAETVASTAASVPTTGSRGDAAIAMGAVERMIGMGGPKQVDLTVRTDTAERASALREHLAHAVDQFMGPLGHWSKTPPTTKGWYHYRRSLGVGVEYGIVMVEERGRLVVNMPGEDGYRNVDRIEHCEWWSERIPEPPR
jgi:hypothetical protein